MTGVVGVGVAPATLGLPGETGAGVPGLAVEGTSGDIEGAVTGIVMLGEGVMPEAPPSASGHLPQVI